MKKFICFFLAFCLMLSFSTLCAFANNNEPSFTVSCSEIINNKVTVTVTVDKSAMTYEGTWASAYFRISFYETLITVYF